ncbi:MAG: T9SS type B sorting domain-containing protein [Flavobacteriaceae bacterium]|nr:T9SS type B sorting domain-containing protein [Flavobacteriaceae bacterium]
MKVKAIVLFILFYPTFFVFSQETKLQSSHILVEDQKGNLIQSEEAQKTFLKSREEKRVKELQELQKATLSSKKSALQQAVEMCSNGGFEQHESITGSSYLKNFLYTIGDPAGPTQCRSITNNADSYINLYNPNNLNLMATSVSSNLVDPYIGDIKGFDQYALKINHENSSTYGAIVQGKRFKTNNENYLKFNYKAVLQSVYDNSHADNQAFVKARILNKKGVVVNEFCLVGDEKNCIFTKVPSQSSNYVTLYTSNWQSGLLDISSIPNNEEFTVEFMASRCGLGGHFGYMYIDDICLLHSDENFQGSVELEPLNKVCPTLPVAVCGSYTVPNSGGIAATVKKITLTVYNSSNVSVYSTSTTSSLDTTNKKFCFTLSASNFPNTSNANYNVGVQVDYDTPTASTCAGTSFNSAVDPDANPGWDISFLNCDSSCNFNVNTAKISQCDANRDGTENFDLTKFNALVVASTTGLSFKYYKNYDDAAANLNEITNFTSYPSTSTSLFVRINKSASCFKIISTSLEVKNPTANITGILNVCSGSTLLTATSGSTYLWNTGETTQSITVNAIGNYSVTVADSFGCSSTATVSIEPSQTAVSPILQITQPSCFSTTGSIIITSTAAEYSFDDGVTWTTNNTKDNLYPGSYSVKIKTINGCISYSQKATITGVSTSYPSYTYSNPLFCGDVGRITILTPSTYYSFDDGVTWVNNSTDDNLKPGLYKIRTKDAQGCISAANNVLLSSTTLDDPTYTLILPACTVVGSITINSVADFYTFDGGTTWVTTNNLTNLTAGSYRVGIKNALGCTSNFNYVYLDDFTSSYPRITTIQPICGSNGNITIDTVADFYSFDDGATWTTNNTADLPYGTYKIKVKNSLGCVSAINYAYLNQPLLSAPIVSIEQPTCGANGKISINSLSDLYSYDNGQTWTTSNTKSLPPGFYYVIVKNSMGCVSYGNGIYLNNPYIDAPTYTVTQPTCTALGSITINTIADLYSFDGGSTWGTDATLANLNIAGYYNISTKNNLGCSSNSISVYISGYNLPAPDYTFINPSCGNIGSITFNATADFYSIDYGQTWSTNNVFSNLSAGYYYLQIKKANCVSNSFGVNLDSNYLAPPKVTAVQPGCGTNGSITFSTTADFYSLDGQNWVTNPVFNNLTPGFYSVKTKNASGCVSIPNYISLSPFYLPNPTFTTVQPTCGNGGNITFTVAAALYSIDGGTTWSNSPVFTNLNPGYYYLGIKNATGCTSNFYLSNVSLQNYYLPNPDFTLIQPTCGTNGSITFATVADSYSFDGGKTWTTNPQLTGLTSGYYNLLIQNTIGCKSYVISVYIQPYYLQNPKVKVIQPSCGNGGSISITTPADQYSFDGGTTWTSDPILLDPKPITYTILIKNAKGCTSYSQYYSINKYYIASVNISSIQPTCATPFGTIIINTIADQYSFDNGVTWTTNPIKKNLASGNYTVIVKNALGCTSSGYSIYISTPPTIPAPPSVQIVQPSSCGATDGRITVTTPAISYSFNDGNSWTTNPTKINIGEGTYIIKIKTNSYSCESLTNVVNLNSGTTIAAPAYAATQPNCSSPKGSITITTNAATYSFDNGLTYVYSNTKNDLTPGIYKIKIKNAAGCISDVTGVTINAISALQAPDFTVVQPNCTNSLGSVSITTIADLYSFDNGITYGNSNTKSNVTPGTYNVKIKYNSDCISLSNTVTINAAPVTPEVPKVIISNPQGCGTITGTITVLTTANLYSFDDGNSWQTNNTASLAPGNYLIRTKLTNGCASNTFAATINPAPNTPLTPTVSVVQPTSCSNPFGAITVTSAAYEYSFDNGLHYSTNPVLGNFIPGTHLVRVKNSSGCESLPIAVLINIPTDYPTPPVFTSIQPDCNNLKGSITITDNAAQYSFDNGTTWTTNATQSNLAPATYLIKVKNNIGCISNSSSVIIIPFTNFTIKPTLSNSQTFCIQQNATIQEIAVTGQNIKWYDALTNGTVLPFITQLQNGTTYYASQTINGCESIRTPVLITIQDSSAPIGLAIQTFCASQSPTLSAIIVTGSQVKWFDAANNSLTTTTTSLQDGRTYYATQTVNGCESTNKLAITISLINTLPANNYEELLCDDLNDGSEKVNLMNYNSKLIANTVGYTFAYYSSYAAASNQLTNNQILDFSDFKLALGAKTIYVRINSASACFAIAQLKLTLLAKPKITIPDVVPICESSSITIDAGLGFDHYLWSTGETTSSIIVTSPNNYWVTVTKNYDLISCSNTKNFEVKKSNIASITSIDIKDWTDNENAIMVYTTGNSDLEYSIDGINYQDNNQFTNLISGKYMVHVRDKNGCGTVTEEVNLLMYPKFFTPNGDGYNDTWSIRFSENEPQLSVKIFDRYGKLITVLNQNQVWNGTYNGQLIPATDYWFVVNRADGKEYKGHFSLKR